MPTTEEHLVGCLLLGSGSWSSYPDTLDSAHTSAGARLHEGWLHEAHRHLDSLKGACVML